MTVFFPALSVELMYVGSKALHELMHSVCEYIAIGCVLQKIANLAGASEAGMRARSSENVLPLGLILAPAFLAYSVIGSTTGVTED